MTRLTSIYVICHPATGEIRYVGKTVLSLKRRLSAHMRPNPRTYCGKWIWSLIEAGLVPEIRLIETVGENWGERERFWIAHYLQQGCRLTNLAEGGRGPNGFTHTDDARRRISQALRDRKRSPDTHKRIAQSLAGHAVSDATRAKLAAATTEHFQSEERRAKQSKAIKAFSQTPAGQAQLAKMERAKKPASLATRAKLSEAGKRRYADPAERAKRSEMQKLVWASSRSPTTT